MERYPMSMSNAQMPNMQMPYVSPASMNPMPSMPANQAAPVTVHASFEEINIYEPKKHHHHHHAHCKPAGGMSFGAILVLYILLVIILRGFRR
ncbi:hypothetical protein [Paenibacillus sp. FSL H7-0331]|uniref:hypothetical protein n=1 Tax=Paenibacillus sp. FSL H7-0331 TaxID=1920421 RepID=UPI00096ED22C|nr:hypothetical protein [Paenibacillus sp. FSL H7-0331]OMF18746.1 hypothetical protein BK127_09875 [Paenibacillus sp. FSL H7-0331]